MSVASLELSKELHELSGWGNTDLYWRLHKPSGRSKLYTVQEMDADNFRFRADTEPNRRFREENDFFNAYDAGYLLRKLPSRSTYTFYIKDITGAWSLDGMSKSVTADTPEDSLCKLAITLIKEGVIT